jgi:hypothetical protein
MAQPSVPTARHSWAKIADPGQLRRSPERSAFSACRTAWRKSIAYTALAAFSFLSRQNQHSAATAIRLADIRLYSSWIADYCVNLNKQ